MLRAAGLLVAVALAGCADDAGDARSRLVTVATDRGTIDAAFGAGARVYRGDETRRLGAALSDAYVGTLAPLLVPDPAGGDAVVYQSRTGRTPVLRVSEGDVRRDEVLARGAISVAWGRDGVAYVQAGPRAEPSQRFRGHVVVRASPRASPARWTPAAGRYVVAAWAESSLLAYRLRPGWPDLLAFDGPGRVRRLAPAAGLVAVSPDGRRTVLTRYGASPPVVSVVDVPTGRELARASVTEVAWIAESGSWSGDRVAAATSEGIAVFEVRDDELELEQVLRFPQEEFQVAGLEPRLDASARRVSAWGSLAPRPREAVGRAVVVECDRRTLRCAASPPFPEAPAPRVLYNPSRP